MPIEGGEKDPTYSPTPRGKNLSDFALGRGDQEEMREKLEDIGYSPEELYRKNLYNPDSLPQPNVEYTPSKEEKEETEIRSLSEEQIEEITNPTNIVVNLKRINLELEQLFLQAGFDYNRASQLEMEFGFYKAIFAYVRSRTTIEETEIKNFEEEIINFQQYLERKPKQFNL